ncbi:hypothetical protein [Roseateles aquatilis]|nr:hypothetical protein [Roseateles aquatilis]
MSDATAMKTSPGQIPSRPEVRRAARLLAGWSVVIMGAAVLLHRTLTPLV